MIYCADLITEQQTPHHLNEQFLYISILVIGRNKNKMTLASPGFCVESKYVLGRQNILYLLCFSSLQRWLLPVSANTHGGNGRDEAGTDKGHPPLHCYEVQLVWDEHE